MSINAGHRVIYINNLPSTHGLKISNLEFCWFPVVISKYSSCSLTPIRIFLSICGRLSLQKQRMNVIYDQLLRHTTVSKVVSDKSDLLSQWPSHKLRNCWALISNLHSLQRHITILVKTALLLLVIQTHPLP